MSKKIAVGLDFDGVVAYNPFRIVRPIAAFVKAKLFGVKKLKFFYPKFKWQQILWVIAHESSVFPSPGINLFKKMVEDKQIEAHLITARYSFLDNHLNRWLRRNKLQHLFKTINLNKDDEQPHLFKEKIIKKYNLDYFIEDNFDIVKHLNRRRQEGVIKTEIFWIYNIFDRNIPYKNKFPFLRKALYALK